MLIDETLQGPYGPSIPLPLDRAEGEAPNDVALRREREDRGRQDRRQEPRGDEPELNPLRVLDPGDEDRHGRSLLVGQDQGEKEFVP